MRHSGTRGAKKKKTPVPPGAFFFAGHVVRRCNLSHETFRNTRSKKKNTPVPPGAFFFLLGTLSGDVICLMRHSGTRGAKKKNRHHDAAKTTRGSPLTPGISKTLHASASRLARNNERVASYTHNFADAPHASVPTGRKQRKGHHLRPEFRGRSRRQHHDAAKTTRGSPLTPGILQTLHASASRGAKNNERVATYTLNFEDASHASVTTHQKQREGRHLCPEFGGRSTRRRSDRSKTTNRSPLTP